jgi:hypothetical protein
LACCRMSLERLVGTRKFPTTLVTIIAIMELDWLFVLCIRSELSMLHEGLKS